ncbi:hypothetical protein AB836_01980 [Rickettsiales bacterium (ex Bugula neritina AB1)]|nr:hypothetical protein AB836_01980 [Rickettsiales bacterium (ex Bugula neritina AB1)]
MIFVNTCILEEKYGYMFYEEKIDDKYIFFFKTKDNSIIEIILLNGKIISKRKLLLKNLKNHKMSIQIPSGIPSINEFSLKNLEVLFIKDNFLMENFYKDIYKKYKIKYKDLFTTLPKPFKDFFYESNK